LKKADIEDAEEHEDECEIRQLLALLVCVVGLVLVV
jgi:hypothetical protein